jgi:rhodanese-related sulfurtransferase
MSSRMRTKSKALTVLLLAFTACSTHRVTHEQAKKMVQGGARLIDVRSVEEFESGHLDGAVNIPVDQLDGRLAELEPKDKGVVVYCASGFRSARAAKALSAAGFSEVGDLGAMSNWTK